MSTNSPGAASSHGNRWWRPRYAGTRNRSASARCSVASGAPPGYPPGLFRQIERARHATSLLRDGASILDTVHETGYFDQAHLIRSFKVLIGETPASVIRQDTQLSFLYKTGRPAPG